MIRMETAVRLSILYNDRTRLTDILTVLSEDKTDSFRIGICVYFKGETSPRLAETFPLEHASKILQDRIDWINEQIRSLGGEI